MAKIHPLQEAVNASLKQFEAFTEDLSADEQMMPCLERHSCKMFIRGNPIRFGYKSWVIASSCAYPFKFETYIGPSEMRRDQPLGPYIVSNLLSIIKNPRQHCVCFDNFFTSYQLLVDLKEKQFCALGTIRENRLIKFPMAS